MNFVQSIGLHPDWWIAPLVLFVVMFAYQFQGMVGGKIVYDGPLFTRDIQKTFRENARDMLQDIADDGALLIQQDLTPGHGRVTGEFADGVIGRVVSLRGKKWQLTSVVSSTLHMTMPGHRGFAQFLEDGTKGGVKTAYRGLFISRRVAAAIKRTNRPDRADLMKRLT